MKKRPLFFVGCICYLTIAAACFFGFNAAFSFLLVTAFLFITAVLIFRKISSVYVAAAAAICISLVSFCIHEKLVRQPADAMNGLTSVITGEVEQLPDTAGGVGNYVVRIVSTGLGGAPENIRFLAGGTLAEYFSLGDRFTAEVEFHRFEQTLAFDMSRYYLSKGIYGYLYLHSIPEVTSVSSDPVKAFLNKINAGVKAAVSKILPDSYGVVISAMILGGTGDIEENITDAYKISGLSHILAVSGFHLSILMAALLGLFGVVRLNKRLAYLFASLFLIFYGALLGFTPPVVRALVMNVLFCLGKIVSREADSLNSLGFSVIMLLLFSPYGIYDVGFNLSVFATLGILVLAGPLESKLMGILQKKPRVKRLMRLPIGALSVTFSAVLFTLPVSVFMLGSVSLAAPLSNLLAAPFVSLLTVSAFILTVLAPIGFLFPIAKLMGLVCGLLAKLLTGIAYLCSVIPFAQVSADYGFLYLWIACSLVLGLLAFFYHRKVNLIKYAAAFSTVLLFAGILSFQLLNQGVVEITCLRADDGCCAIIQSQNKAVVLSSSAGSRAGYEISSYLKSRGVAAVELLVLPDCTAENAGGVLVLSQKMTVRRLLYNDRGKYIEETLHAAEFCGSSGVLTDAAITMKNGMAMEIGSQEDGCTIFFRYQDTTVLFSFGDIDCNLIPLEKTKADLWMVINGEPQNYGRIRCRTAVLGSLEKNYTLAKALTLLNTEVSGMDFQLKISYKTRGNGVLE